MGRRKKALTGHVLGAYVPGVLWAELRAEKDASGLSISEIVCTALRRYISAAQEWRADPQRKQPGPQPPNPSDNKSPGHTSPPPDNFPAPRQLNFYKHSTHPRR